MVSIRSHLWNISWNTGADWVSIVVCDTFGKLSTGWGMTWRARILSKKFRMRETKVRRKDHLIIHCNSAIYLKVSIVSWGSNCKLVCSPLSWDKLCISTGLNNFFVFLNSCKTRTTYVVWNAGCLRSRYTLKLSLKFFLIHVKKRIMKIKMYYWTAKKANC